MTEDFPQSLAEKRLQRTQHLSHDDATREIDIAQQEFEEYPGEEDAAPDEEFYEHARRSLRRYREIFAKQHTQRGDFGAALFELLEAGYIDKEQWARDELDDFFGGPSDDESQLTD